jgi:GAF domain-containing protein
MRRRSAASGQSAKSRRRKAVQLRRNARKAKQAPSRSASSAKTKITQLTRERDEALEQQRAAAEVLKIISASRTELQPVLEVVVRSAARYCKADDVTIFELDGQTLRIAAHWGVILSQEVGVRFPCTRGSVAGRTVIDREPVHVIDLQAEAEEFPEGYAFAKRLGQRTTAGVPLLREGMAVGTLQIRRTEVNPFTDKQIALLGNFAAQAVIAIENARLLNELRESLEQQTATSEVLKVISSSPGELEPVFQAMLENALRICEAEFGVLNRCEGEALRVVAMHGAPQAFVEERRRNPLIRPPPQTALGRVMATKQPVQIADIVNEPNYFDTPSGYSAVVLTKLSGARTVLAVPMLKENELVGAFVIFRQEVRPFTDKQIELVKNFAAQAVIAIENARLLNELRESLQQQTATADVLKVISSSPDDMQPVFEAIGERAEKLCDAEISVMSMVDGDQIRLVSINGVNEKGVEAVRRVYPMALDAETVAARTIRSAAICHVPDVLADTCYQLKDAARITGNRGGLGVPMIREGQVIGAIFVARRQPGLFTDAQVQLLKTFAAQAVIAIENTRLLNELKQSLEEQTATSEVLKVISRSRGELEPVFQGVLRNATHICNAKFGILFRYEHGAFQTAAVQTVPPAYIEYLQRGPHHPGPETGIGQMVQARAVVHVLDAKEDLAYTNRDPFRVAAVELAGVRTFLSVPMIKEDELVGSISIFRQEVRPFTDKQIELVKNFAAQAVIAIENARLLNDLNKLNQQLEQRVVDQVSEIERMGRLRRFLPPQVADLIVASGTEKQLESHRREITALFCDLRGFTGFSESSDPEDVMALLREYHAAIGEIINKYGGTLERYAGDGVMVVFNDPLPVDNPALQAVRMAVEMRAAIGELIEKWRKLGHDIGFGIGIAHGFATLGTIGFEGRFDYAAIGTVSNVASRLCDEAKPGQILISPRVLMAVEKDITVEPIGDFALKGIRRPLTAYNVLAAKAAN